MRSHWQAHSGLLPPKTLFRRPANGLIITVHVRRKPAAAKCGKELAQTTVNKKQRKNKMRFCYIEIQRVSLNAQIMYLLVVVCPFL